MSLLAGLGGCLPAHPGGPSSSGLDVPDCAVFNCAVISCGISNRARPVVAVPVVYGLPHIGQQAGVEFGVNLVVNVGAAAHPFLNLPA